MPVQKKSGKLLKAPRRKMYHADNEKGEKRISKRNRTTKSRMHNDAWRERKREVLRKLEPDTFNRT